MASATPGQQDFSFLPPMGIFCTFSLLLYLCREVESPEILVELNLGLYVILESSLFPVHTLSTRL